METFVVNSTEIEGRVNPLYYKPEFLEFDKKLDTYETKTVEQVAKVICGPFGSTIQVKDYREKGVPLIRISNIKDGELDPTDVVYIDEALAEKLKSYRVSKGDLIVSQRGTLGLTVKVPAFFDGAVISANFIAIKNISNINPDYLRAVLSSSVGRNQLVRRTSGQVQTKITTDDVKVIKIPIVSEDIQGEATQILEDASLQKKRKEAEAEDLLSSIGEYILSELGIELPEIQDVNCYVVNFDEIENRIDPNPYQPRKIEAVKAVRASKYETKRLSEVVVFKRVIAADNPEGLPYLGLENIESNTGFYIMPEEERESFGSAFRFSKGDVIFPKLRPYLNKVHYAEFDGYCSTEFHVLECSECNPLYLFGFLNSYAVINQTSCLMTGNTLPRLQTSEVESLLIPVPPKDIQNKIADEIRARMEKGKKLRQKAAETLEEANEEAEKMILGV